jgi:hypothetical protein
MRTNDREVVAQVSLVQSGPILDLIWAQLAEVVSHASCSAGWYQRFAAPRRSSASGWYHGGCWVGRINVTVLEFFSCKDGGLLDACSCRSGLGDVFRKAPIHRAHHTWKLLDWMGFDRAHLCFSDHLVSQGALRSSVHCCHHETRFLRLMVKSAMENVMEAEIR